ncbi:MAG: hypothetical protein IPK63_18060 [Candidatus Competibacteraceae bacterium]|nr:hypothetical protein [Candidatus Competibacteraceae bacterium]
MKSLYNKSGILPALFMNSRVDCGISWNEHRRDEPVKRDGVVHIKSPTINDVLTEYMRPSMLLETTKLTMALQKRGVIVETLKPIDPQTIQVGDTVRLVGSRTISEWPNGNLEVGEDYKVKVVDSRCADGMSVGLYLDEFSKPFWIYDDDLMLVEPA